VAAPILLLLGCFAALILAEPPTSAAKQSSTRAKAGEIAVSIPKVEPVAFKPMEEEDARAINAKIPLSPKPNPAARPFAFSGDDAARGRAVDCLAAAALYEAGNDAAGQRAVAQVVINRARHPAFPKSICGVVFQGSKRRTGCQFSFTCDGAMARRYSSSAWNAAQQTARAALSGNVYAPVGLATHFHTDWVVPYWSDSLEKITAVGTHLFFRWPGGWGRPAAYRGRPSGNEPNITKMAALSPFHRASDILDEEQVDDEAIAALNAKMKDGRFTGTFQPAKRTVESGRGLRLVLGKAKQAEEYLALAEAKCAGKKYCKILGWLDDGNIPEVGEIGEAGRNSMVFSYLRDEKNGFNIVLWNCKIYPRADKRQCMRR